MPPRICITTRADSGGRHAEITAVDRVCDESDTAVAHDNAGTIHMVARDRANPTIKTASTGAGGSVRGQEGEELVCIRIQPRQPMPPLPGPNIG